jgi:hypothetical protein
MTGCSSKQEGPWRGKYTVFHTAWRHTVEPRDRLSKPGEEHNHVGSVSTASPDEWTTSRDLGDLIGILGKYPLEP